MALLDDPDEPGAAFVNFTMSGTVSTDGKLIILANGTIEGRRINVAIPLTEWQVGYLGERTDAWMVARAERAS